MPGISQLGTIPAQRPSPIGQAIGAGIGRFMGAKQGREERELNLQKIDYDKKVKTANMILESKKFMNDEQASQLDSQPMVRELFEDLDWPYPEGSLMAASTIKIQAIDALTVGGTLPGLSVEETKKAAGVFIAGKKITATDIKEFEKDVPLWEKLIPGKQKGQREVIRLRKEFKSQFGPGIGASGAGSDPLGVR